MFVFLRYLPFALQQELSYVLNKDIIANMCLSDTLSDHLIKSITSTLTYRICVPNDILFKPGKYFCFLTMGIKCFIERYAVLVLFIRKSLGVF